MIILHILAIWLRMFALRSGFSPYPWSELSEQKLIMVVSKREKAEPKACSGKFSNISLQRSIIATTEIKPMFSRLITNSQNSSIFLMHCSSPRLAPIVWTSTRLSRCIVASVNRSSASELQPFSCMPFFSRTRPSVIALQSPTLQQALLFRSWQKNQIRLVLRRVLGVCDES